MSRTVDVNKWTRKTLYFKPLREVIPSIVLHCRQISKHSRTFAEATSPEGDLLPHVCTINRPTPGGTGLWLPCVDDLMEQPTWHSGFIVPNLCLQYPITVLCSGTFDSEEDHKTDSEKKVVKYTLDVRTNYEIPPRRMLHCICEKASFPTIVSNFVFIEKSYAAVNSVASMIICRSCILYPRDIPEQTYETRRLLVEAIAMQRLVHILFLKVGPTIDVLRRETRFPARQKIAACLGRDKVHGFGSTDSHLYVESTADKRRVPARNNISDMLLEKIF
ncbi:4337_t:CDS:2 [Paraglomus occultum]|uniref:4337_t:CDS:1 n=1 Tax=Paraglomus occultum TaxID=144539 RepID=A0A9N9FKB1_9GLOM|nr:4337_t:CDS:2 [Paraglomus occultum]